MDIIEVLEKFKNIPETEQAWIMVTLLDYRWQNLDAFKIKYGTYANKLIESIL